MRFNPLYSDEFSHTGKCNKDGSVHDYIFLGVKGGNFQIK